MLLNHSMQFLQFFVQIKQTRMQLVNLDCLDVLVGRLYIFGQSQISFFQCCFKGCLRVFEGLVRESIQWLLLTMTFLRRSN